MKTRKLKLPKPYMIMREDGDGNDFATIYRFRFIAEDVPAFKEWVDWEGTKFATKEEAQIIIDHNPFLEGATVIEVLEETRVRG